MAKFKLGLLIQDIVQTPGEPDKLNYIEDIFTNFNFNNYYFDYETRSLVVNENQEYVHQHEDEQGNQITEKYLLPITAINNNIDFSYSYDESITLKEHSQKQLQFKMLKYVQYNGDFLINPYAAQITNGSLIILYDKFKNISYFIVTKISYSIKNANVEISYDCQDVFSYIHTRQNSGYTITNDETKEDFIGALKIDEWANKIVNDCKIAYRYLPLTATIYKGYISDNQYELSTEIESNWNNGFTILRDPLVTETDDLYNAAITFAINNSNALNALIQLAEQRGLNIQVDDKTATFYFIPAKAEEFSGLYYSPQIDLSDLSISQQAQSLTTVLNVTGQTLNNTEITLLPKVPNLFLTLFSSDKWENDSYKPGYFQDFVNNQTKIKYGDYTYIRDSSNDLYIIENVDHELETIIYKVQIPFGNYETIQINPTFTINLENNDILTFEELIKYRYIDSEYTKIEKFSADYSSSESLDLVGNYEYNISTNGANLQESVYLPCTITIQLQAHSNLSNIQGLNASISFNRTSTVEEEEFARMADRLPWLENKLINLDYFYRRQLLSQNDYSLLLDKLYNELRIVNGKMIYYNNLYYAALLNKTNMMAELQNAIDVYMADFNYYVQNTQYQQDHTQTPPVTTSAGLNALTRAKQSFEDLYSFLDNTYKSSLLILSKTLEQYVNNYYQYEQIFFKNIYNFRKTWNDKVYFTCSEIYNQSYADYTNYTLGEFYERFKSITLEPVLQQQAALIGTELQEYWDAAYSASKYCGWYIPESFEDSKQLIYYHSSAAHYALIEDDQIASADYIPISFLPKIDLYTENNTLLFDQGRINVVFDDDWVRLSWTTNIHASDIWNYQDKTYCFTTGNAYYKDNLSTVWTRFTQTPRPLSGQDIWTDGTNYYYSNVNTQYQFNSQSETWENKTWTGSYQPYQGRFIWHDQNNTYHNYQGKSYVLNNGVWEFKTWRYLDANNHLLLLSLDGRDIWTDHQGNIYYSVNTKHYKLNNITGYWEEIKYQWPNFFGSAVWKTNDQVFFTVSNRTYVLKPESWEWIEITFKGRNKPNAGSNIWTDNNNIYWGSSYTYLWKTQQYQYITNSNISLPAYIDQAFKGDYHILENIKISSTSTDTWFESYLSWTPYTNINKINYYTYTGIGGKIWNDLRPEQESGEQNWKIFNTRIPIGGIWVLLINILFNKYYPQNFSELEEITEKHNNIWRELYQNYGNYLLENSYTDSLATNSEDLYNATMAFFKDQCAPEKSYDLSIIDIYALKGYTGQEIKVTDQIRIASQDFYQELDELKDILDQTLFIKEIQYKLRSDTDIKLSVNIVKYQDKMIKRLVNLIR